jgi:Tfp pilus assembly protein PilO
MPPKFSSKEKIGLLIAGSFMSFALLDRLMISPINSKLKQINQDIKISEKQLAMELRNVSQKETVTAQYQKYVRHPQPNGPDEEKMTAMLSAVEDLARESGTLLLDIKPQPPKPANVYKEYNITLEAEGEMEALVKFLYQINNSPQLLRVETLRLNLKDKDSKTVKASVLISKISLP